ncbi:MAG: hypothetical protein CVU44_08790 [Chloroflexi bacterium HGW-Chloroflexi-6]|nr:MAG: hypothetical protein CVU44_08790 [Chloroflexi bacterium HGW-Chloroflexi-6]
MNMQNLTSKEICVKKFFHVSITGFLIFTLVSCGLPQTGNFPTGTPPVETPFAAKPPAETLPPPSPTVEIQAQLPPADFVELYRQKVDSGEWSEAQGLIEFLKAARAEAEIELPQGFEEQELNGIVALARLYLQTGMDEAARNEIKLLLDLLFPSEETLLAYAIPESEARVGSVKLAAPAPQAAENCAELWSTGFPAIGGSSYPCFFYGQNTVDGVENRVYMPLAWHGDASKIAYYEYTLEAMRQAALTYLPHGPMPRTYAVFAFDLGAALDLYAESAGQVAGEACPIVIYPPALLMEPGTFKQAIAHEMFHCFQEQNIRRGAGYDPVMAAWFVEGSAEYFSNLAYPEVDYEYRNIQKLNERSLTLPLHRLAYGNFLFFQHMGNQWGDEKVIEMLKAMPLTGSFQDALNAIVAYPGLIDLYESYARAFLANQVADTSGILYPYTPVFARTTLFGGSQNGELPHNAFVLYREKFIYQPGREYTFSTGISRNEARIGTAPIEFPAWQAPTWQVDTSCNQWEYMTYSIGVSVNSLGGLADYAVNAVEVAADRPCEQCLIGTWKLDPTSYLLYANSLFPARMGVARAVGYNGEMFVEYNESGKSINSYNNFIVFYKGKFPDPNGGAPIQANLEIKFLPVSSAVGYSASETTLTYTGSRGRVEAKGKMVMPGSETFPYSFNPDAMPGSGTPLSENYACKGNFLAVIPNMPPSVPNTPEPIIFIRFLP